MAYSQGGMTGVAANQTTTVTFLVSFNVSPIVVLSTSNFGTDEAITEKNTSRFTMMNRSAANIFWHAVGH